MKKLIQPCGLHCIKVNHLGVTLGDQTILEDINLHVHCGSLTAIIGKNGAGKSTLIRAILDDLPHTGNVEFKDRENGNLQQLRIGYVPQSLNIEKNTPISVYDLLAGFHFKVPAFLCKTKKMKSQVEEFLRVFGVENLIDKQICNLSGGQLQRVLLSLAIMNEPHLLLLDEPVSGIDSNGMEAFYETMDELKRNYDLAIILISHDLDYVERFADQVVLIDKKVQAIGSPREVYSSQAFEETFATAAKETMYTGHKVRQSVDYTGANPDKDTDFVYHKRQDVKPQYPRQQHTCDHAEDNKEVES